MAYITSSSQSCSLASWPHLNPKGRKTAIAALEETYNYYSFEAIGIGVFQSLLLVTQDIIL